MQEPKIEPGTPVDSASRRELLKGLSKAAYIAPVTLALLSSEKAAAY